MPSCLIRCACTVLLILLTFFPEAGKGETLVVRAAIGEWPPFFAESLPYYGFVSRIVSEAYGFEGYAVEYGFFPWARSLSLVEQGEWDAAPIWYPSGERLKTLVASDTVLTIEMSFFYLRDHPFDWETVDDLRELRIGTVIGYSYGESFDAAIHEGRLKVEAARSEAFNLRKLLAGRLDVAPMETFVGHELLRTEFTLEERARIAHHPKPVGVFPHAVLFARSADPGLVEAFNRGLRKLHESGSFDAILREALGDEGADVLIHSTCPDLVPSSSADH